MSNTRRAPWLLAAFLAACGGGGGSDGGSTPPPVTPPTSFALSGQIRIAQNMLVDSDVNDPVAPHVSNDTGATAQRLPNPATLAGYVNVPGAGDTGRSQAAGDVSDLFRIDAVKGQTVSVVVADPAAGDIDLYLYDQGGNEVAFSNDTGRLESIPIQASGSYYVEVFAYSGASNYVLSLGQSTAAAGARSLASTSEFVPGEAIVRWRSPAATNTTTTATAAAGTHAAKRSPAAILSAHALSQVAGTGDGAWLVKLDRPSASLLQARRKTAALTTTEERPLSAAEARKATLAAIKRLRTDPDVEFAEPNYVRHALATTPNDEYYKFQWHYPMMNLPAAWDVTTGSNAVTVAVIDTGVLLNHPDLQGQLLPGYDFISNTTNAADGNGIDNNPDDPGDKADPAGSSFHGTHVAGTIAAASNNGKGVAGVAWNARIMPLRVLGKSGGADFDIIQAMLFAARLSNSSETLPARRADIINLSLGGPNASQAVQDVVNQVRAAGVIVVAAAGNDNSAELFYPASYDGVVSVSAVNSSKALSSYSNYGSRIDIAAPGGDWDDANGDGYLDGVLSTRADDSSGTIKFSYDFLNGTSMAAPHVAGAFALMKSVNPALTPADIDALLAAGRLTVDMGAPGRDDKFGHGMIDALKAVQAAPNGGGTAPALLVATPTALNFTPGTNTLGFTAANGGGGSLQVTQVQVSAGSAWLSVASPAGASGLGAYTVTVNRGAMAPGAYNAVVRLVSAANTVEVAVVMQITGTGAATPSDLGQHYVLLVDPDTLEARHQVETRAVGGVYGFNFNGIPRGKYRLVAGSDADNNGSICDVGEACSAYLSLDNPVILSVTENRSGLDFFGGYVTSIAAGSAQAGQPQPTRRIKLLKTTGTPP